MSRTSVIELAAIGVRPWAGGRQLNGGLQCPAQTMHRQVRQSPNMRMRHPGRRARRRRQCQCPTRTRNWWGCMRRRTRGRRQSPTMNRRWCMRHCRAQCRRHGFSRTMDSTGHMRHRQCSTPTICWRWRNRHRDQRRRQSSTRTMSTRWWIRRRHHRAQLR